METKNAVRESKSYEDLSRSPLLNHLETEKFKIEEKTPKHTSWDFLTGALGKWIYHYFKSRFGKKADYNTYKGLETGIYKLDTVNQEVSIAIAADWATNTLESIHIAREINKKNPAFTIHLGDTYFVGEPDEIAANFLPINDSIWPRGDIGSFAVLGNHEMYARGISFFRDLLPHMGLRKSKTEFGGQGAGFFCLENSHWRILGLDTGYHSVGKLPILEMIPWFAPDCHFDDKLISWLKDTVKLGDPNDKRGLVVLTHHQYITAFKAESEYLAPAKQLAELIGKDRPILWLFGHEHKFAMYEKTQVGKGVMAYCRCIGNGGMPIELKDQFTKSSKKSGYLKLVMADNRQRIPGLGYNGYTVLKLNEDKLTIDYCDVDSVLVSEEWVQQNGKLFGTVSEPKVAGISAQEGKTWSDAVK
ncbi:MAG: metallophosphoesterase [Saprospiraceae bacterium]|nr:metallophosphoesterase [Saprospiraceae bacterium]MBK9222057.1 metallophosphoesterase [Saprospiraceae bacterium]MBK9721033.1 metallophosphoesterase [Saprospiraceae bacterium]MBK9728024.1 metallophosphoesterase [Saprospiraceae bacterium]